MLHAGKGDETLRRLTFVLASGTVCIRVRWHTIPGDAHYVKLKVASRFADMVVLAGARTLGAIPAMPEHHLREVSS